MATAHTIDEVLQRLEQMDHRLRPSDGVRWFNRLYLEVTRAVRDYVRDRPLEVPNFLAQLDVYFGNSYFAAFDAAAHGGDVPRAWSPLFDERHSKHIAPLQFALAGMNAHINHDLAIGVVATCEAMDLEPGKPEKSDYDSVNVILRENEARVKTWLLTGAVKELDHAVAPADDLAAIWSITRARDAAWIRSRVLWRLRGEPELAAAYRGVNDRATELAGRAMLLPLP
jgi:hypothetical protein